MAIVGLDAGWINLTTATNSPKSQSLGRRIYLIEQQGRRFWLKLQLKSTAGRCDYYAYEHSFLNELKCYTQLSLSETPEKKLLLNFSILDTSQYFQEHDAFVEQVLCVEDAALLFSDNISQLSRAEIFQRLKLSLDVLENLHEYGYIHGDLKIAHFRYSNDQAALIDFEQASQIEWIRRMPNTATPRYMAPELFHAESKSFASDVYALGMIWLEWLTQIRFQQKSYLDWAKLHCQRLKIDLPVQFKMLEEILLSMLMKNKAQRCSNIYQLKQVLSRIV
ncbi:protein kinase domain-containing protein [Acinetobacter piscicola]|uniref:protein kinase domain-containing protein n=1 Tax=Acinetobacter piscicola TaxID=2006115 RepID=UPI000B7EF19A|nr:protein kinase [Acinetobacter piscicola]